MTNSRKSGVQVPPLSTTHIAHVANTLRNLLVPDQKYFPIVKIYEILDSILAGAHFEIRGKVEMGDDHGRTYPDRGAIWIREDVYEGARKDNPRDRFTMCHELGHLILHRGISFARVDPENPPKIFMNSEWQADVFASHLLMPAALLPLPGQTTFSTIGDVAREFGVSYEAARVRLTPKKKPS